ncbi:MAG: sulfotransferase [Rhodanobacteraceae bacterium]
MDLPPVLRADVAAAVAALQARRMDEAVGLLKRVLAAAPDHAETLRLLGVAERQRGCSGASLVALEHAVALRPDDALIQSSYGGALATVGRNADAIAAYRRACELAPDLAVAWNNLGKALSDDGQIEQAAQALQRSIELAPDLLAARFSLAYTYSIVGDKAAAIAAYRGILARRPVDGEAWLALTRLAADALDERDLQRLRELLARADIPEGDRIPLTFALGHLLQHRNSYAEAFAAFSAANAGVRRRQPWDAAVFSARLDRILAAVASAAADPGFGHEAIFIVGMPRSGTTLIEQMLAAHPKVDSAGESTALSTLLREESQYRGKPFPDWLADPGAREWRELGQRYLDRAHAGLGSGERFIDKLPGNWLYLGAVQAMLPGACVIVCRRDPLETCFSCFRQHFAEARQAFAYDIDDIAAWWRDFDRAVRHWRIRYGGRLREQQYERLLEQSDAEVRALLAFCDLPFEPVCLQPQAGERVVRTLSALQVREPLRRTTALGAHYGSVLDPLRRALAQARKTNVRRYLP